MNKKPWYIWLSILAFIVLWGDTVRKILFTRKNPLTLANDTKGFNLWLSALGQMFISIVGLIIVPIIAMGLIFGFITQQFPNGRLALELVQFLILYLLGVFIAYKHVVWRKKNLG